MLTLPAGADFEIGHALLVDVGREQEFKRVIPQPDIVLEPNDGQTVIEDFKHGFLAFPFQPVSDDKQRLPLAFGPQIFQRALRGRGTGEFSCLVAGVGSEVGIVMAIALK